MTICICWSKWWNSPKELNNIPKCNESFSVGEEGWEIFKSCWRSRHLVHPLQAGGKVQPIVSTCIVGAMFMFSSSHSQVGETSDILPWRQKFESETKVNVYHTFAQCNIIFATEMISCLFPKSNSGSLLDFSAWGNPWVSQRARGPDLIDPFELASQFLD